MNVTFSRTLGLGMAAWAVGAAGWAIWFMIPYRELGLFAVGLPFMAAHQGFVIGLTILIALALFVAARRRTALLPVGAALLVYALPLVLWAFLSAGLLYFVPVSGSESDMGGLSIAVAAPVAFLCGCLGAALSWRAESLKRAILCAIAPAALIFATGATALGGYVGSQPEFWRRGAIEVAVNSVNIVGNRLEIGIDVELRSAGAYHFAPLYLQFAGGSSGARADMIEWDGEAPAKPGHYRGTIVWDSAPLDQRAERRMLFLKVNETVGPDREHPILDLRFDVTEQIAAARKRG